MWVAEGENVECRDGGAGNTDQAQKEEKEQKEINLALFHLILFIATSPTRHLKHLMVVMGVVFRAPGGTAILKFRTACLACTWHVDLPELRE